MIFIVAADSRSWSRSIFNNSQDVFFTIEKNDNNHIYNCEVCKSTIRDLAILSQCNHSIITHGKLSFWTSYLKTSLNDSITVFPKVHNDNLAQMSVMSKLVPSWKEMEDPCFIQNNFDTSSKSLCLENNTRIS